MREKKREREREREREKERIREVDKSPHGSINSANGGCNGSEPRLSYNLGST